MQFFLILVFAWLIQCGESVLVRTEFQFNASVYDGSNVIYRPHASQHGYDLYRYPEELCSWLSSALPKNLTQMDVTTLKTCTAVELSKAVNHTKNWKITMSLVTSTPQGQLINFTCPTFVGLFRYFLEVLTPFFSQSQLQFKVLGYLPPSIPYNPPKPRDVEIIVNGYMCDKYFQPIPVKDSDKYNSSFMMEVLKKTHYVNLGYAVVTAPQVMISGLTKFVGIDRIYLTFREIFPSTYVQSLQVNPDCDFGTIVQMIFTNVQADAAFIMCGVTTEVVPPPTEKPTTVKPTTTKTTSETETTALASTTKRPMEMLVCAFILSHLLANI